MPCEGLKNAAEIENPRSGERFFFKLSDPL